VAQRLVDGGDGAFGSPGDVGGEFRFKFSIELAHGLFVSECGMVEFVGVVLRLADEAVELVGDGGGFHFCQSGSACKLAMETVL